MQIRRFTIKNFGKLHDVTCDLSAGVNILYGENESGKSTIHSFLKCMLYGNERQRGRAAASDRYRTYEPWENPGSYGGIIWYEHEGKLYRLSRNFAREHLMCELYCESSGQVLSPDQETIETSFGGISEAIYDNTVSVAQMKSATGGELVRELQNYMACYQNTGSASVHLDRSMQLLKMKRKGYQNEKDRRMREMDLEMDRTRERLNYAEEELNKLKTEKEEEKDPDMGPDKIKARMTYLEKKTTQAYARVVSAKRLLAVMVLLLPLLCIAAFYLGPGNIWISVATLICSILCLGIVWWRMNRRDNELRIWMRRRDRFKDQADAARREHTAQAEAIREKELKADNLRDELDELRIRTGQADPADIELEAIELAMETIGKLSGSIQTEIGSGLRQRVSEILSQITQGKYTSVLIDGNLLMSVNTGDRLIPLNRLSRGTIEQIYFALRMAAGELLCHGMEFPVILDDIFGTYDEDRLMGGLTWLNKADRQIIISTCSLREAEIYKREGWPFRLLSLS